MSRKGLVFTARGPAVLRGYQLRFNKRNQRAALPPGVGFANLVPESGARVEGVLYELPGELQERLDRLERSPEHYERLTVTLETLDGEREGVTYRARPELTAEGLVPSRNYVNHILSAGALLSAEYRAELERLETFAGACAACHKTSEILFHREAERLWAVCSPCLEARRLWGETLGRQLSILDTEAVMQHLLRTGAAYDSVLTLLDEAVRLGLIQRPTPSEGV
jgi:gamma-glutamylcyclotransferase (GGCT)/AIG2-like uncharacterized protein YtfP